MPISETDLTEILSRPGYHLSSDSSPSNAGSRKTRRGASKRQEGHIPPQSTAPQPLTFTVMGSPVPKPRQSQRDKWAKRSCVLKYRAWADRARQTAQAAIGRGQLPNKGVTILAYFPMPASWSKKKKAEMVGKPHRVKPDLDNVIKCLDALFDNDSVIYEVSAKKLWDDGAGPRTVITLF